MSTTPPAEAGRPARPLTRVLAAMTAGSPSLGAIALETGLDLDTVRAAVEQLTRMGRVEATRLSVGCPDGGCGSCASGTAPGSPAGSTAGSAVDSGAAHACAPGCGAAGPSATRSGPVLIGLRVRG